MYRILITAVFCIFAVNAESKPQFVIVPQAVITEGTPLEMKCAVDEGAGFMASKKISIVHKSAKTGEELTISDQGNMIEDFAEKGYSFEFAYDPVCSAKINIAQATADVDGEFICKIKMNSEGEPVLDEVATPVTVLGGIDMVYMTVNGQRVDTEGTTLEFEAGNLEIGCVSTGSNPEPDIHLHLGDDMIKSVDGQPLQVTTLLDPDSTISRRSYKGSVTTVRDFQPKVFGKKLSCHAETILPEGITEPLPDKTVSVTLDGIVDEPKVSCTNNTASVNDRKVTLTCLVSKQPPVKSLFYNVGNRFNIYPGNTTDLVECVKKDLNTTHDEVVLQFFIMKEWHFTANIYLDVQGYDDSTFQFPVYVFRDYIAGAPSITASLPALVLLAAALSLLI